MSRILTIVPNGWHKRLDECEPGFFVHKDNLYFISEYKSSSDSKFYEVFCSSGEYCHLNETTIVQPVIYEWEEVE